MYARVRVIASLGVYSVFTLFLRSTPWFALYSLVYTIFALPLHTESVYDIRYNNNNSNNNDNNNNRRRRRGLERGVVTLTRGLENGNHDFN